MSSLPSITIVVACLLLLAVPGLAFGYSIARTQSISSSSSSIGMVMSEEGQTHGMDMQMQMGGMQGGMRSLLRKTGGLLLGASLLASPMLPSAFADEVAAVASDASATVAVVADTAVNTVKLSEAVEKVPLLTKRDSSTQAYADVGRGAHTQ